MKMKVQKSGPITIKSKIVDSGKKVQMSSEVRKPYIVSEDKVYTGSYEVTPIAWNSITLRTKDKIMEKNVLVKEVPYFETRNDAGTTVYIASEV